MWYFDGRRAASQGLLETSTTSAGDYIAIFEEKHMREPTSSSWARVGRNGNGHRGIKLACSTDAQSRATIAGFA